MKKLFIGTVCSLALALGLGFGCGGDDDGDADGEESGKNLSPDCDAIRKACHSPDEGKGTANECHELAHDGNAAMCTAKKAACLAACK